jgi:hypothetical protein
MAKVNIQELLDSGVHFGHLTRKWNPNMAPYIYTERNGVHIIDLYKTAAKIEETSEYIAVLEINPLSKAHTLIIPKQHGTTENNPQIRRFDVSHNSTKVRLREGVCPCCGDSSHWVIIPPRYD